jgi:hypothetical protein
MESSSALEDVLPTQRQGCIHDQKLCASTEQTSYVQIPLQHAVTGVLVLTGMHSRVQTRAHSPSTSYDELLLQRSQPAAARLLCSIIDTIDTIDTIDARGTSDGQ